MDFIKWPVIYKRLNTLTNELDDVGIQKRIKYLKEISQLSETAADVAELMDDFNRQMSDDLDISVEREDDEE